MTEEGRQPNNSAPGGVKGYYPGNPIQIPVELEDESGVAMVEAIYCRRISDDALDEDRPISLRGTGGHEKRATVNLAADIPTNQPPGEYLCFQIRAYDALQNPRTERRPAAAPRFRIDELGDADYEGPKIRSWGEPE